MTAPNAGGRYDRYDKYVVDQGVEAPAAPDPLIDVFFPPPLASLPVQPAASSASAKPPLLRQPAADPGAKPPLLRQPAADPNAQPFKFTDVGPNAPQKGMPLQAGVEYNRINLGLDAQMQQYDAVNNVARYNALQLQSLEVQIESTMTRVGGQIFDTGDVKKLLPPQGAAKLGSADGVEFPVPDHWRDLAIMWVCRCPPGGDSATFYSSVCQLTQVHHSSFGDGVIAAGEWIVRKGKLWKMSANSGHYRPTIDALYRAVLHLACARQADSTLFLYDTKLKTWADVNWGDFIAKPTGGGRYTTHPDSPVPS